MTKQTDLDKQFAKIIEQATSMINDPKQFQTLGGDIVVAVKKRITNQTENWTPLKPITKRYKPAGRKNKILFNTGQLVKGIAIQKDKYDSKTKYHELRINTSAKYGKYHTAETGRDWLKVDKDLIKIAEDWIKGLKIK